MPHGAEALMIDTGCCQDWKLVWRWVDGVDVTLWGYTGCSMNIWQLEKNSRTSVYECPLKFEKLLKYNFMSRAGLWTDHLGKHTVSGDTMVP